MPDRLDHRLEQRLERIARADHPRGDAVDAGVEVVQPDVRPLEEVAAHELLRDGVQVVAEDHDVVAVPADAAADVQQDLGMEQQHRADLVGDGLGRMVVAGVEV